MFVREYRFHLINGEVLRVGECVKDEDHTPILDQFMGTDEDGFVELGVEDGPQCCIPMRNILYVSMRAAPGR